MVAPREGSVDRNLKTHTELLSTTKSLPARGAWIEIYILHMRIAQHEGSLPARGAWIEIMQFLLFPPIVIVAPREGSVDRNHKPNAQSVIIGLSLPARGAWIEIV